MNLQKPINILNININNLESGREYELISDFLREKGQKYIVTPNPEIILQAQTDNELARALNNADLAVADGIGLKFAGWLMGKNLKRTTGADLTCKILAYAEKNGIKIGIFNYEEGLSSKEDIKKVLESKYPKLEFVIEDIAREWTMPYYKNINIFEPRIIFVNLGSPWQEKFLYKNMGNWPFASLGIAVGGSFDFISGKIKRAPKIMRTLGLEWFWRLLKQPARIKRIINAVIVFPFKFMFWLLVRPEKSK